MEYLASYSITILTMAGVGFILLLQLIILDVVGIKAKHTPGHAIEPNHNDFIFRASRAHANTNESIAIYILFAIFGILSSANPLWLNVFSGTYLLGRTGHMLCYYAGISLARSICFGISIAGLLGMLGIGLLAWL